MKSKERERREIEEERHKEESKSGKIEETRKIGKQALSKISVRKKDKIFSRR